MLIKILRFNEKNKVEFTKDELQALLDEVFEYGKTFHECGTNCRCNCHMHESTEENCWSREQEDCNCENTKAQPDCVEKTEENTEPVRSNEYAENLTLAEFNNLINSVLNNEITLDDFIKEALR